MKRTTVIFLAAASLLLTACGAGGVPEAGPSANSVINADSASSRSVHASIMSATAVPGITTAIGTMAGQWLCTTATGRDSPFKIEIIGNLLRDRLSGETTTLTFSKGIVVSTKLVSYVDVETGQTIYSRQMWQGDKAGFASFFVPSKNNGAGAGMEFSLGLNGTLMINDVTQTAAPGAPLPAISMNCVRDQTKTTTAVVQ